MNGNNVDSDDIQTVQLQDQPPPPPQYIPEKIDKNSLKYRLRNQLIPGYSFLPSIKCSMIFSLALGLVLLILGLIVLLVSNSIVEVSKRYDDVCGVKQPDCKVTFIIPEKMEKPIYLYLKVENFYQNHRLYVKSYSADQLRGEDLSYKDIKDKCKPVGQNKDLSSSLTSVSGVTLDPEEPANPCGLVAASFIEDDFTLKSPLGTEVDIRTEGIAWEVDRERKFKRNDDWKTKQYRDVQNERFINWMSFSTLYNWKKLWGIIDEDLEAGEYEFIVDNRFDVLPFEGEKHILLSNVSILGGTSKLLATLFFIMGGSYVALAIALFSYKFFKKISSDLTYGNLDFNWD